MEFSAPSSSSCNYREAPLVAKNSHCAALNSATPAVRMWDPSRPWHRLFSVPTCFQEASPLTQGSRTSNELVELDPVVTSTCPGHGMKC